MADKSTVISFPSASLSERGRERRRYRRLCLTQGVKVVVCDVGRYLSGRTANVSQGGALIDVDHPSLLVPGQRVKVGIAWSARQTVLDADDLLDATVVRSLGHGGGQSVAVCFARAQNVPALAVSA